MAVAVGGWAIGAVASAVGGAAAAASAAAFVATSLGSIVAGVIGGAIVGATIGAIGSLVTGGDLGKGILYGAIGGAVAGGISGYFSGAAEVASSSATGTTAVTSPSGWESVVAQGGEVAGSSGAQTTIAPTVLEQGAEGAFQFSAKEIGSKLTENFGGSAVEGVINLLGKGMEGHAAEEMAMKQAEWHERENALQRKHELELANIKSGGSGSDGTSAAIYSANKQFEAAMAKIAEERRQFNEQLKHVKGKEESARKAYQNFRTVRPGSYVQGQSILDQASKDVQENTPPLTSQPVQTGQPPAQDSQLEQTAPMEEAYAV